MGLQLMQITGYTDQNFQSKVGNPYKLMINPESLKWSRKVDYNEESAPDTSSPSQTYKSTPIAELSFDIVIDCTGVVDKKRTNLQNEIQQLENIVYNYNGKIHRPNYVKIRWGKNITFNSVLKSFDTTYTLFKPNGEPLRAKISLSFGEYVSRKTVENEDQRSSPDLTHLIEVKDGDTLPLICNNVYGKSGLYTKVARFNNLNKFRSLHKTQNLILPPLVQPTESNLNTSSIN